LLLLTDDGDLAHSLLHPSHPVWKVYRVRVQPALDASALRSLADGSIVLDGRPVAPARVRALDDATPTREIEVALREGRHRQVRRMVEAVGSRVIALHRTAFGPVDLGDLTPGQVRALTEREIERLRRPDQPAR
jgi:23S rRNA pseudouridine2605 synthase